MKNKIIWIIIALAIAAIVADLLHRRSSASSPETGAETAEVGKDALGEMSFESPDLKMKDPDPDPDDFKGMSDIKFDDGAAEKVKR